MYQPFIIMCGSSIITLVLTILLILWLINDSDNKPRDDIRQQTIDQVLAATPDGQYVDLYYYRGHTLLLVGPKHWDYMSAVYTLDGQLLGFVAGGVTKKGDQTFPDWSQSARFLRRLKQI